MRNVKGKRKEKLQISRINLTPHKGAPSLQEMKEKDNGEKRAIGNTRAILLM